MPDAFSRFPARVLFSDGRLLKKAAVITSAGRAQVAEQAPGKTVVVVADRSDVESVERQADRSTLVSFADGSSWRVGKGEGCSCNSPLKTWYSQALRGAG